MRTYIGLFTLLSAALFSLPANAEVELVKAVVSHHTYDGKPTDDLESTSFQNDRMVIHPKWASLEPKKIYSVKYVIEDRLGKIVLRRETVFKTTENTKHSTWVRYRFKEKDFPGDWTIRASLDDTEYLNKILYVSE
ncbi:MAG: hypothetical protein COB34_06085 [Methylophilaceae bacterium]|nr:MAG: hypothetical protein COB34_06085 [Methylophilaceae bacterium]